ncbi:MAG: hypothetical protein NT031_12340, partial [Planctomycetota bacterium]|nr:hypothetical protein [Planctomycetota bacterium]
PGATGTFHKTSGSVPDAKTLVPMQTFVLNNLAPTIRTLLVTDLGTALAAPGATATAADGIFMAMFL